MPPTDDQISRYLADPLSFPPEFKNWVVKYLEQHQPSLLIRQLAGTLLPSKIAGYPGDASKGLDGAGNWTGSMFKIFDSTAPGTVANFDFPTIPGTFAHLQVECYLRGDTAATAAAALLRFNNDSGANYQWQRLYGNGNAATADEGLAGATSITASNFTANTGPANAFGELTIKIQHYAEASNHTAVDVVSGYAVGAAGGGYVTAHVSGRWLATGAVNRITLTPNVGNFVQNSRVTVYGIGV